MGAGAGGGGTLKPLGAIVVAALVVLLGTAARGRAHTGGSTGYASVTVHGGTVRYRLALPAAALPSPMAEDLRLAEAGSAQARARLLDVVRRVITLRGDGVRCEPGPGRVESSTAAAPTFTMLVDFACPSGLRDLQIRDDVFDVLGPDHHTLTKIEWPGGTRQFAFEPSRREARFSIERSTGRDTRSFLLLGIHHILSGYDHLLFLLGLMLPGGGVLTLTKIITAFTLAHSVTLSLAVLDIVVLPDRLVEAVIGLSIAAVAAENLWRTPTVTRRWLVSFGFGLAHGFGFSGALRELKLPAHGLLLSLLGFNTGVELGQALVVVVVLPALMLLRDTRWERPVFKAASLAILLVGLVLFVERALL
jgi:hypothetical protein